MFSVDFPSFGRSGGRAHTFPHPAPGEKESFISQGTKQQQLPHLQHWGRPDQPGEQRQEEEEETGLIWGTGTFKQALALSYCYCYQCWV